MSEPHWRKRLRQAINRKQFPPFYGKVLSNHHLPGNLRAFGGSPRPLGAYDNDGIFSFLKDCIDMPIPNSKIAKPAPASFMNHDIFSIASHLSQSSPAKLKIEKLTANPSRLASALNTTSIDITFMPFILRHRFSLHTANRKRFYNYPQPHWQRLSQCVSPQLLFFQTTL